MIECWRKQLDGKKTVGAVLMDLSKAFDCVNHRLLIAKLHAYGFSRNSLCMIYSYLTDRQHRVEVDGVFSSWKEINIGVPQGSILGPLLFNIYINDLFFSLKDPSMSLCNYADDNTLFSADTDCNVLLKRLENEMKVLCLWFSDNGLQLNADKCKLLVVGAPKVDDLFIYVNSEKIEASNSVKLLGVIIDRDIRFTEKGNRVCKKIASKLKALKRIVPYLPETKCKLLADTFVTSQANYCPLVWNFSTRKVLNSLERLQSKSSNLVSSTDGISIHRRNCETLLSEIYKTKFSLNPSYMQDVFPFKCFHHDMRNPDALVRNKMRTTKYGLNSVSHIGTLLWETLPASVKNLESHEAFKMQVTSLNSLRCRCHLCQPYIHQVGYL